MSKARKPIQSKEQELKESLTELKLKFYVKVHYNFEPF